jgi:quercetin dioxygenase-like cupin family protein
MRSIAGRNLGPYAVTPQSKTWVSNVNESQQKNGSTGGAGGRRLGLAPAASMALWMGVASWLGAALWSGVASAAAAKASSDAIVKQLMTRELVGSAGKEVLMVTVEYLKGGASLPHRHNAQVFVYVLEGKLRMQVEGSAAVTLGAGETFYEGPEDIHTISANASRTKSARMLVFIIKDKGVPVSSDAGPVTRP